MKKIFLILVITFLMLNAELYAQKISPSDGIRISYLDIDDVITGDYYIQPNGLLNLPLIGVINTNNKVFGQIKYIIESRYDSLYKNNYISVNALYRINILGEVAAPGFYYVSDSERFTAILALAGGTTAAADLEDIKLIRNFKVVNVDVETIIQEGSSAIEFGLQSGDQVFVPRRWWVDNQGFVTTILSVLALALTTYVVIVNN